MSSLQPSICRLCLAYCPIEVTVEDGRAIEVRGDRSGTPFEGYLCPKGRALPAQHNDPARLLRSLKRSAAGRLEPIGSLAAIDEVAARVEALVARHGPASIALYQGTGPVSHPTGAVIGKAWLRAIGSPLAFSAATIDKPAAQVSVALHGNWHAGAQSFEDADAWMIVGANPVIAKSNGAPLNNPGMRLKQAVARGLKLVVLDPRRTETARLASVHLPLRPGTDAIVLAGIVREILAERMHDQAFVDTHAEGLDALRAAVAPFTPERVAARTDVTMDDLIAAARAFASGTRGGVVCSTGASFGPDSNLTWYLALCLNTLCGRWAREGERATYPNVLLPAFTPKAQPFPPYPVFGKLTLPGSGLRENASGLPTGGLADAILAKDENRIRALFCQGGNPLAAWPDQRRAREAMAALDLLVVFDYQLTETAALAHYVIASPLTLEVPGSTQKVESLKWNGVSRGYEMPWAQYTPAVARPPAGSDVLEDGEFFFRLAQRMNRALEWINVRGAAGHLENPTERIPLDMSRVPDTDELLELTCRGSRVPLEEVKRHPHGKVFEEVNVRVARRDADCTARLQLGDPTMMADLARLASLERIDAPHDYPMTLVCRRPNRFMNSMGQSLPALSQGRLATPAYLNPADMAIARVADGDPITLRSRNGWMRAEARADPSLKRGVVSSVFGFPGEGSVNRLLGLDERDPITGIPRMTAVPVSVERAG